MSEQEIFEETFAEREPKRKEPKQISFRVSESEFEKLKRSAEFFQMIVPAFVKSKAHGTKLVTPFLHWLSILGNYLYLLIFLLIFLVIKIAKRGFKR